MNIRSGRSAIWGGGTLGFIIGAIVGIFNHNFGPTLFKGILIGAAAGLVAELLGAIGDKLRK
jgi:hypothetical protein